MVKTILCKWKSKEDMVAILISDKIDFKDCYKRQRRHYIMIEESIQEDYITIVNIFTPNIGAPKYTNKQKRRN